MRSRVHALSHPFQGGTGFGERSDLTMRRWLGWGEMGKDALQQRTHSRHGSPAAVRASNPQLPSIRYDKRAGGGGMHVAMTAGCSWPSLDMH